MPKPTDVKTLLAAIDAVEATPGGPQKAKSLRTAVLELLETGAVAEQLQEFAKGKLSKELQSIEARITGTYALPSVLFASSVLKTPPKTALGLHKAHTTDYQAATRLAKVLGLEPGSFARRHPESKWAADAVAENTETTVVLEQSAAESLLMAVTEGYLVKPKGKKKGTEVFGYCLGSSRLVEKNVKGKGRQQELFVHVTRCVPQLRARMEHSAVEPNDHSRDVFLKVVGQVLPHLEVLGDFHSHPYDGAKDLADRFDTIGERAWSPSKADVEANRERISELRRRHHTPRIGLIVAVAEKKNAKTSATPRRWGENTHQVTIAGCQLVIAAYRVRPDGQYGHKVKLHSAVGTMG